MGNRSPIARLFSMPSRRSAKQMLCSVSLTWQLIRNWTELDGARIAANGSTLNARIRGSVPAQSVALRTTENHPSTKTIGRPTCVSIGPHRLLRMPRKRPRKGDEMAVYRPTKDTKVWWYDFIFEGQRVRESAKTRSKTVAKDAERARRREMEES